MGNNIRGHLVGIGGKIFQQDILFRKEKTFARGREELTDMSFDGYWSDPDQIPLNTE